MAAVGWKTLFTLNGRGILTTAELDFYVSDGLSVITGVSIPLGDDGVGFGASDDAKRLWTALRYSF